MEFLHYLLEPLQTYFSTFINPSYIAANIQHAQAQTMLFLASIVASTQLGIVQANQHVTEAMQPLLYKLSLVLEIREKISLLFTH